MFQLSEEAAVNNTEILRASDFDLAKVLDSHPGTISSYGSELRPLDQLRSLLHRHPQWDTIEKYAVSGIDYPFVDEISEEDRLSMLHENIERGNHRSALASDNRERVDKAIRSDVELGYGIPLTIEGVMRLKDAEVCPLRLQTQQTINENGKVISKKRLTQDLTHRAVRTSTRQFLAVKGLSAALSNPETSFQAQLRSVFGRLDPCHPPLITHIADPP